MKRLLLIGAVLSLLQAEASFAQTQSAIVVTTCGTPPLTYTAGQPYPVTQNTSGQVCGSSASTPSGTQNVNITAVGGTSVTSPLPVSAQGAQSNASTGTTGATNLAANSYNYGWDATTSLWRQALIDTLGHWSMVGSSAAAATDDGSNPVKEGGVFMTTPPTYTNGQRGNAQIDTSGNWRVLATGLAVGGADSIPNNNIVTFQQSTTSTGGQKPLSVAPSIFNGTTWDRQQSATGQVAGGGLGTGAAVEEAGDSFAHITTATTTLVKTGAGILHKICENTIAASASITAYNNTTATAPVIGVITNPLTLLQMGPLCATYDLYFSTGLTIVTTGAQDITVTYR